MNILAPLKMETTKLTKLFQPFVHLPLVQLHLHLEAKIASTPGFPDRPLRPLVRPCDGHGHGSYCGFPANQLKTFVESTRKSTQKLRFFFLFFRIFHDCVLGKSNQVMLVPAQIVQ